MQYGGIRNLYEQLGGICQKYSRFFDKGRKGETGHNGEIPLRSEHEIKRQVKDDIVSLTLFFNKNGLPYDTDKVRKMDYEEALMFYEKLLEIKAEEQKELEKANGSGR